MTLDNFLDQVPQNHACLVLKNGTEQDARELKGVLDAKNIQTDKELVIRNSKGRLTVAIVLPPYIVQEIMFSLVQKGINGEVVGYEADKKIIDSV
jgi:hypothetical protein